MGFALHLIIVALLCTAAVHASKLAGCSLDGSAGLLLPLVNDSNGNVTCLPGFYCPNLDPSDPTTFPVACPPSPKCQVDRLFSKTCSPPETYEPRICPSQSYCPTYNVLLDCPDGYFCPMGTATPIACAPLSLCPEGSKKPMYLGGFLFSGLAVVLLAIVVVSYRKKFRFHEPPRNVVTQPSCEPAHLPNGSGEVEMLPIAAGLSCTSQATASIQTICGAFAKARGDRLPISLDATRLRVSLPDSLGRKVLLRGVSGSMRPGKVTAIMGPSGAGKTVFMTTLLGGVSPSWSVTGDLRVNGHAVELGSVRQHIAFVPQDDILHSELSVDANFFYSSEIRLPPTWSSDERAVLREAIVERLGLDSRRSMATHTLSASQRKLCSVGVELCAAPQVLFLDEPTSGLDSKTSLELVRLLKELAVAAQLTVVMVVHQPRVEIWHELDEVLFLAPGGLTVYQGQQKNAAAYFTARGVTIRPQDNPADVLMDAIAAKADTLVASWTGEETRDDDDDAAALLPTSNPQIAVSAVGVDRPMPKAPFLRQLWLSHMRSIEKQLSALSSLVIEMVVATLTGLLIASSVQGATLKGTYIEPYTRLSPIPDLILYPRLWMYMVYSLGLAASVAGVNMFGRERQQYFREAQTGYSRVAYFIGNATSAFYRVFLASLVFATLMFSLGSLPARFEVLFPVTFFAYAAYYGLAACVSVVVGPSVSALLATLLAITVGSFNGSIDLPIWMKKGIFTFYVSQLFQEELARNIDHWTNEAMGDAGYAMDTMGLSFTMILLWVAVTHVLALVLMLATHRDKQR